MTRSALLAAAFLTACAGGGVETPTVREVADQTAPDLMQYGVAFQGRMATELEALPEAECPREGVMPTDCSALLTWILDQQRLRDQVAKLRD